MSRETSNIGVQRIIEKQMRAWELQKSQRPAEPRSPECRIHSFVAISRMAGSEGSQIAQMVGQRLRRPVFDKELFDHIASSPEARQRMADLVDERDVGWFEEILWPLTTGTRSSGRHDYFRKLCEAVVAVAQQGPAVFLGRGVAMILPQSVGLRVKIVASRERCLARFAETRHIETAEAETRLERIEHDRNAFLSAHFTSRALRGDYNDLTINTDRVSVEMAVELIAKAAVLKEASETEDAGALPVRSSPTSPGRPSSSHPQADRD